MQCTTYSALRHHVFIILTAIFPIPLKSPTRPSNPNMSDVHLLVLIHGMWGNPSHLAHTNKIIREVKGGLEDNGVRLEVLVAETNKDESTYDGIDWGGERVAEEV